MFYSTGPWSTTSAPLGLAPVLLASNEFGSECLFDEQSNLSLESGNEIGPKGAQLSDYLKVSFFHRHLRNIDCLTARTACCLLQ
jgi:hypothetical protein